MDTNIETLIGESFPNNKKTLVWDIDPLTYDITNHDYPDFSGIVYFDNGYAVTIMRNQYTTGSEMGNFELSVFRSIKGKLICVNNELEINPGYTKHPEKIITFLHQIELWDVDPVVATIRNKKLA
jgi:hypothetical protein